jgi:hypothetical protein
MRISAGLFVLLAATPAFAQYTKQAGQNEARADSDGGPAPAQIARDTYGNAQGSKYDLAVDGAFDGQTILVIDFYSGQYNYSASEFSGVKEAVKEKGFSVVHMFNAPPPDQLEKLLAKSNQFWLVASCDNQTHLTAEQNQVIKRYFESGHGVYLWGDNDPCNADADKLASLLIDARVQGDLPGDQTVGISQGAGRPGVVKNHLLGTGVEHIYEGVTVATVKPTNALTPVIYGSAGNLVAAAYEQDGKRLIVDGGFTRMYYKWDSAGTGRYIKNAAAWLANFEHFGSQVLGKNVAPSVAPGKAKIAAPAATGTSCKPATSGDFRSMHVGGCSTSGGSGGLLVVLCSMIVRWGSRKKLAKRPKAPVAS